MHIAAHATQAIAAAQAIAARLSAQTAPVASAPRQLRPPALRLQQPPAAADATARSGPGRAGGSLRQCRSHSGRRAAVGGQEPALLVRPAQRAAAVQQPQRQAWRRVRALLAAEQQLAAGLHAGPVRGPAAGAAMRLFCSVPRTSRASVILGVSACNPGTTLQSSCGGAAGSGERRAAQLGRQQRRRRLVRRRRGQGQRGWPLVWGRRRRRQQAILRRRRLRRRPRRRAWRWASAAGAVSALVCAFDRIRRRGWWLLCESHQLGVSSQVGDMDLLKQGGRAPEPGGSASNWADAIAAMDRDNGDDDRGSGRDRHRDRDSSDRQAQHCCTSFVLSYPAPHAERLSQASELCLLVCWVPP